MASVTLPSVSTLDDELPETTSERLKRRESPRH